MTGHSCPLDPTHGELVPRRSTGDQRWFAGCPTFHATGCRGRWSPRLASREAAGRAEAGSRGRAVASRGRTRLEAPERAGEILALPSGGLNGISARSSVWTDAENAAIAKARAAFEASKVRKGP